MTEPTDASQPVENQAEPGDLFPPGCGLWLGWMLLSTLGTGIGWAVGWQASLWGSMLLNLGTLTVVLLGLVVGLGIGLAQWPLLRGTLRQAWLWPLASGLGWAVGFPLGALIAQQLGVVEAVFGIVLGAVVGTAVGLAQWPLLRRQVTAAFLWVPANIFGWSAGLLYYRPNVSAVGLLVGALYGIVSALALLWLVHRPVANEPSGQRIENRE